MERMRIRGLWKIGRHIRFVTAFIILAACVDPIDIDFSAADSMLVVEGLITNRPGPYFVRLSNSLALSNSSSAPVPVSEARIVLRSDQGESENFEEFSPGEYKTSGQIIGTTGSSYYIEITLADGRTYESVPDKMYPSGRIEEIRYEYEERFEEQYGEKVHADVFNIFLDGYVPQDGHYTRWKFTGTYKVETNPELHQVFPQPPYWLASPVPCSGYVVAPGGALQKMAECTCCTCWSNHYEEAPVLSDGLPQKGEKFENVKVTEVPVTRATFYEKYMVTIEQMSLGQDALDFFKAFRAQKLSYQDLFQAFPGTFKGNIKAKSQNDVAVGLFYAASIDRKNIFIDRSEVPYNLPPADEVTIECYRYYPNSTTIKPEEW